MRKNITFILPLILIILASGCVSTQTGGNGVDIIDFKTDFNEVSPGEQADFYLYTQNLGSVRAENLFAEILGLDNTWKFKSQENCGTDGQRFSLMPPRPFYNTPGQEHLCKWSYYAPETSGLTSTYEPIARLYYDYETTANIGVMLFSREEMIRLQNSGDTPTAHIITKSSSPIDVGVNIKSPIRVSGKTVTFSMELILTNLGSGTPCIKNMCKETEGNNRNYLTMNINLGQGLSFDEEDSCGEQINIALYKKSNTILCKIMADLENIFTPQQRTIDVKLDYSYFVSKELSISVGN